MQTRPLATSPFLNFTSSLRHFVSFSPFLIQARSKSQSSWYWVELFIFKDCNNRYAENISVPGVIFLNP